MSHPLSWLYSKYEAELERKKAQVDALQVYKDNDPEEITKYSKSQPCPLN